MTDNCFHINLSTKTTASKISWSFGTCSGSRNYTKQHTFLEKCCLYPGHYTLSCMEGSVDESYREVYVYGGFLEIRRKRYCEGTSDVINVGKF